MIPPPPRPTLFPYTTLFRSVTTADFHDLQRPPARLRQRRGERADLGHQRARQRRVAEVVGEAQAGGREDRKSTRLNSSHMSISYAVFCLKKKKKNNTQRLTT